MRRSSMTPAAADAAAASSSTTTHRSPPHSIPELTGVPIQVAFGDGTITTFDDAMVLYHSCYSFENAIDSVYMNHNNTIPSPFGININDVAVDGRVECAPEQLKMYYDYYSSGQRVRSYTLSARHHLLVAAWCVDDKDLVELLSGQLRDTPFIYPDHKDFYQANDTDLWQHVRDIIKEVNPHISIEVSDDTVDTSIQIKNPLITDLSHSNLLLAAMTDNPKLDRVEVTSETTAAVKAWTYYRTKKAYSTLPADWLLVTKGAVAMRDLDFLENLLPSLLCTTPQPMQFTDEEKEQLNKDVLPKSVLLTIMRHTILRAPKKAKSTKSCMGGEYDEVVETIVGIMDEADCVVVLGNTAFKCLEKVVTANSVFIGHTLKPHTYYINAPYGAVTNHQMEMYLEYIHGAARGNGLGALLGSWQDIFAAAWAIQDEQFLKNIFPSFIVEHQYRSHASNTTAVMGVAHVEEALAKHMTLQKLVDETYTHSAGDVMMLYPLKRKVEELVGRVHGLRKARKGGDQYVIAVCMDMIEKTIAGDE